MATPRKEFLDELRRLESKVEELTIENERLKEQVELQGQEAFDMAGATMQIRAEDAERLAAFRKTNTELVEFVDEIASAGRSKYRDRARKILGF